MMKRIAINTGGGDAPGLNAVIRAVALSALNRGWQVLGIRNGYEGLLEDDPELLVNLDREAVRGIGHLGGTILGTTNRGDPFNYPTIVAGKKVPTEVSSRSIVCCSELALGDMVCRGGARSMCVAQRLMQRGLRRVSGVPATLDSDLTGMIVTFGFATAVATTTDALDKLYST